MPTKKQRSLSLSQEKYEELEKFLEENKDC